MSDAPDQVGLQVPETIGANELATSFNSDFVEPRVDQFKLTAHVQNYGHKCGVQAGNSGATNQGGYNLANKSDLELGRVCDVSSVPDSNSRFNE